MWQKVLHGGALELRGEVIKILADSKGYKTAFRYAACGCADQLMKRGDEVFVAARGCGHKLCPRCGRRRGGKYAKRIIEWLATRPHGDLWSMCLTQPVITCESLKGARARMAPKQRSYMRWLSRRGLVGAMTVVHVVWSPRANGWHYHVHVLVELPKGKMTKHELLSQWEKEGNGEKHRTGEEQARLVVGAGSAIKELADDAGDPDFWHESKGPIAKAVQYPLRDLAQGVTAWRLGGDVEQMRKCAVELVRDASGWKMFRAWGAWRKAVQVEQVEEEKSEGAEGESAGSPGPACALGTVGRLWRAGRAGDQAAREIFKALERSVRNESEFAARLVRFCRLACGSS